LANAGFRPGCASAVWIQKLLLVVYQELFKGNHTDIRPAKKGRDIQHCERTQMGMDSDAKLTFRKLKWAFKDAPILNHFNLAKLIILQTDACGFAIAVIPNQYDSLWILRSANFYYEKCSDAEQNYNTHNRELLAIVDTMMQWHHNLEGANHKALIQCDPENLNDLQMSKVLSRYQARWAVILSSYDLMIEYLE
jgi:hypothetical protein